MAGMQCGGKSVKLGAWGSLLSCLCSSMVLLQKKEEETLFWSAATVSAESWPWKLLKGVCAKWQVLYANGYFWWFQLQSSFLQEPHWCLCKWMLNSNSKAIEYQSQIWRRVDTFAAMCLLFSAVPPCDPQPLPCVNIDGNSQGHLYLGAISGA